MAEIHPPQGGLFFANNRHSGLDPESMKKYITI
jgi:hypothetical protein